MAAAAGVLAATTVGCAGQTPPQGGVKTPADRAAFMERTRCSGDDDKLTAAVLNGTAIVGVKPAYSNVGDAKGGPQPELRSAIISVSALPGLTAEWLDSALECHSAKTTLGHAPAASNDPFWLPEASIDIDVRPAKDGLDIVVTGYSPDEARRILGRASAFAPKAAAPTK
jgi:hypothetical protein